MKENDNTGPANEDQKQHKLKIKKLIIEKLNITHIEAEELDDNAPLFGKDNALGLDSIDAIEIILALKEEYGVRLDDQNLAREILLSINTIADFLEKEKRKNNSFT